ncbi:HPr kinase/phosphorylase [Paracoccus liaowanqingii]|uniref:HPr kinase/phosphorylase n=1 Tax=Paracoccus liaowanqingii TaxID=2560053 RepID=UPI0026C910EE
MMQLHATTVALEGRGLVILGPSGSGKSGLALELMAVGAVLVADDRTDLRLQQGRLIAQAPPALSGRIEARGWGSCGRIPRRRCRSGWPATWGAGKRIACHRCTTKIGWGSGFRLCWGPIDRIFALHCGS